MDEEKARPARPWSLDGRTIWLWVIVLVTVFALTVEGVEPLFTGLLALAMLGIGATAVILLIWGACLLRPRPVLRAVGMILAALVALEGGVRLQQAQEHAAIERGDDLVRALAAYREREGVYPDALSSLVPRDLDEVPRAMGLLFPREFHYRRDARDDDYRLRFDAPALTRWNRTARQEWTSSS